MTTKEKIEIHQHLEFKHFSIEITPNWKYKVINVWLGLNAEVKTEIYDCIKYAECQTKDNVLTIQYNPKYTNITNNAEITIKELFSALPSLTISEKIQSILEE